MEEIYTNVEFTKPVCQTSGRNRGGSSSSEKRLHRGLIVSLGLLNVLLLVGLITLGVRYHDLDADLSTTKDGLTSMTAERDLLNTNLTEMTEELVELQRLFKLKKTCPAGWRMFRCSCYFFSTKSASWDEGREDCRDRGADLLVVDDDDEQEFISNFTNKYYWIGLTDKETEGSWKWVDGTPLNVTYWSSDQPDNGGGDPQWGEEDCVHIRNLDKLWNDFSCEASYSWICEKVAQSV